MEVSETRRGVETARATVSALGLTADDAVVIHNSDRLAVRLTPCDVLARVAPAHWREGMAFEVEVARRLAATDTPIGALDPRVDAGVHLRDGFCITLWTYYEPLVVDRRGAVGSEQLGMTSDLSPEDYAQALVRLHGGYREMELEAPHISTRLAGWAAEAADRDATPELPEGDRELVNNTLNRLSAAIGGRSPEDQLLHGEPHPGNLLNTRSGPRFVDLETCQRGPVEYDLAYAPEEVAAIYPGADHDLVGQFRILMWAGVASMRWKSDDQYPHRDYWRTETLNQLRAALDRYGAD